MNENSLPTSTEGIGSNVLGPLQPYKKPRKAAKVVLSGLLVAAGVAGGAAIVGNSISCAGVPNSATTRPAGLEAKDEAVAGGITAMKLEPTTQPTPPTTMESSTLRTAGVMVPVQLTVAKPYTVQAHDTLFSIARKQLGDTHRWKDIAKLNPDVTPPSYTIKPGRVIKLPEK